MKDVWKFLNCKKEKTGTLYFSSAQINNNTSTIYCLCDIMGCMQTLCICFLILLFLTKLQLTCFAFQEINNKTGAENTTGIFGFVKKVGIFLGRQILKLGFFVINYELLSLPPPPFISFNFFSIVN